MNIVAIIKHIKIRNSNYDAATDYLTFQHDEFTSKPLLDDHGKMIPREEYLLDGINCDPYTFGRECEALNAQYKKNQTRREIKAHHYIISFDPRDRDENGLTPEHAQKLGMEFAAKNFPGHQTIVCTHPDGHNSAGNIHVHIVINSVRKLTVERASFMEHPRDAMAGYKHHVSDSFTNYLKQETMTLCQRESFYQVDLLSPAKVRITDREYWAQRKGQKKLDEKNQEKIVAGIKPTETTYETEKGFLRRAITSTLEDSTSFEIFQKKLFENYGISIHESRGRFSYQLPDRNKPIRARMLGTDFEKEHIFEVLSQDISARKSVNISDEKSSKNPETKQSRNGIRLIVDIEKNIKAQQNRYYAQKVKIGNLQQMSKTLAFLQENGIGTMKELQELLSSTSADNESNRVTLKATEEKLKKVNLLIKNSGQYLSHKKIYAEYRKASNKPKFREEHLSEIMLYEAARDELKHLSNGEKIPSMKQLKAKKEALVVQKNEQYENYSFSRAKLRELQTIHSNVLSILGDKDRTTEKSQPEL